MSDWREMIDAARAENERGIEVRRGKKYTTVAIRVEMARRFLGDAIGIETEIVKYGTAKDEPIVVRAIVRRTDNGAVLGTGMAEEIRGKGQVNSTSALENAETSAIGRALAALGLSGGEFASANEMDGVDRKSQASEPAPKKAPADVAQEWLLKAPTLESLDKRRATLEAEQPGVWSMPEVKGAYELRKGQLAPAPQMEGVPF